MAIRLPFKRVLSFGDSTKNWEALKKYTDETDDDFESRIAALEALEAWNAPTYATGWSNFGAPYPNGGYYKDRDRVYLRGAVKNGGTGTGLITTLPTGYRPTGDAQFTVVIFGGTGRVTVASDGTVTDNTFTSPGSKTITLLNTIQFRVS